MKVYEAAAIRNVAVVGHGGCGKTQLVSAALLAAGAVNRLGLVDEGSTVTDFDDEEIARKHSLSSSLAYGEWQKTKINFIDTPGFANFFSDAGGLPLALRPFASLMRIDRPIGVWLLYWPCAWGVALAGVHGRWDLFAWLAIGAFAMRSAGCVYNDIVDKDLDRSVERTRLRPLASGRTSLRAAWLLTAGLCLVGLVVLLQLDRTAQLVALASLVLVAAYPFMKRVTWWPQAWLGLVFSWGALVGWPAVTGSLALPAILLWLGSVAWVVGYDTIYAIQDVEDDALAGVKSSARRLGANARAGVAFCYALALIGWGAALWTVKPHWLALVALLPASLHLASQALRVDPSDGEGALALFRSNRTCGLLVFLAMLVVGLSTVD